MKLRSASADLEHILWTCPLKDNRTLQALAITSSEQWETVLLSSDPGIQLRAVQMAEDPARAQRLLTAVLGGKNEEDYHLTSSLTPVSGTIKLFPHSLPQEAARSS